MAQKRKPRRARASSPRKTRQPEKQQSQSTKGLSKTLKQAIQDGDFIDETSKGQGIIIIGGRFRDQ